MQKKYIFTILPVLMFCSVMTGRAYAKSIETECKAQAMQQVKFILPVIPETLINPEERANYLAVHYWDNFDFADTSLISRPEIIEQIYVDFIQILPIASAENIDTAITILYDEAMKGDRSMFDYFCNLGEKYLYDHNSPMKNEELYIHLLQYLIASPNLDTDEKMRPKMHLQMALKNRVGDIASDFVYTLPNGETGRMHDIKAEYTILFFNNPDCKECTKIKNFIALSPVINSLFGGITVDAKQARVAILAIYVDADIPLWKSALYPTCMINSYDAGQKIMNDSIYELKAIPCIYLLDKDKRVILKDTSIESVEKCFN